MSRTEVVCARFQPPHRGHFEAIEHAAASGARVLVLMLGADEARSLRNPWSDDERRAMIESGLPRGLDVDIVALRDVRYDRARWTRNAEERVRRRVGPWAEIGVLADLDPRSDIVPLPAHWRRGARAARFVERENLLRALFFWRDGAFDWTLVEPHLAVTTRAPMQVYVRHPTFEALRAEARFIREHKQRWVEAPFPPVFVTVDALVTWGDEVLLIERAGLPGKGLLALPGGFIEQQESLLASCLRELAEETGVDLAGLAPGTARVFDDPFRSLRGRTITHLFHFSLEAALPRPLAQGGDDARHALWLPRQHIRSTRLFEDHYAILQNVLGLD